MKVREKLKGFGGKVYSGFLWIIQIIMMGIIGYGSIMIVGIFGVQRLVLLIYRATQFGQGATPNAVDIGLTVGFPTLFIMGLLFFGLLKFYKKLWQFFTKMFDKMRVKFIDEGDKK